MATRVGLADFGPTSKVFLVLFWSVGTSNVLVFALGLSCGSPYRTCCSFEGRAPSQKELFVLMSTLFQVLAEHRAHEQGCWAEGGSHWKARQPESAGKLEEHNQQIMVRDLDLAEPKAAFGRCQLADTTVVCALHCDGSPHRGAENLDVVVLERVRRRKERTYPELVDPEETHVLWFLALRLEAACPWRPRHS